MEAAGRFQAGARPSPGAAVAGGDRLPVAAGDADRPVEGGAPARGLGGGASGAADLLQDVRDGVEEGRAEVGQVGEEVVGAEAGRVAEAYPGAQADQRGHPAEDMGEREEEEGGRRFGAVGAEDGAEQRHRVVDLGVDVAVGQRAALGAAGGAGGVDEGGEVGGADGGAPFVDHRVGQFPSGGDEVGDGAGVELPEVDEGGQPAADAGDQPGLRDALPDAGGGPGVVEDPRHLVGGGSGVDGDGDQPGGPGGAVDEGPLVGGTGHERQPVAAAQPVGDQALGDGPDLVREVRAGQVGPAAVGLPPGQRDRPGRLGGVDERQVTQGTADERRRQRGQRDLADGAVVDRQRGRGGRGRGGILAEHGRLLVGGGVAAGHGRTRRAAATTAYAGDGRGT